MFPEQWQGARTVRICHFLTLGPAFIAGNQDMWIFLRVQPQQHPQHVFPFQAHAAPGGAGAAMEENGAAPVWDGVGGSVIADDASIGVLGLVVRQMLHVIVPGVCQGWIAPFLPGIEVGRFLVADPFGVGGNGPPGHVQSLRLGFVAKGQPQRPQPRRGCISIAFAVVHDTTETELETVQGQLVQLQAHQDSICEHLEKGIYTVDMFTKRNSVLSRDIKKLQTTEAALPKWQTTGKKNDRAQQKLIPPDPAHSGQLRFADRPGKGPPVEAGLEKGHGFQG